MCLVTSPRPVRQRCCCSWLPGISNMPSDTGPHQGEMSLTVLPPTLWGWHSQHMLLLHCRQAQDDKRLFRL